MSDLRFSLEGKLSSTEPRSPPREKASHVDSLSVMVLVIKAENLVKKNFFTSPNVIVKIVDLSQPDVCYTSEQAPKSSNAKWNETFNL